MEKAHKKWSTIRDEGGAIRVAGRELVERTIVSVDKYDLTVLGYGEGEGHWRVTVDLTVGNADERAVTKAFTALGERVAKDTLKVDVTA